MVAANPNDRIPPAGSDPLPVVNRLVERVFRYLDQHPEISRAEFLLEAVHREIDRRERQEAIRTSARRRPSAEDVRLHAWLSDRVAMLHYERNGLWPRLRRFLAGNALVRWLRLRSVRATDKRKG
jgi:hypothetical protein